MSELEGRVGWIKNNINVCVHSQRVVGEKKTGGPDLDTMMIRESEDLGMKTRVLCNTNLSQNKSCLAQDHQK